MYNMFPNIYQPMNLNQSPYQAQTQQLTRVNGIDGAKAFQMGINSTAALFDANEDLMYIKQTDGAGFPTIRTFKFEELHNFGKNQENNVEVKQYVTRKELEDYVKQFIQPKKSTKQNAAVNSAGEQPE